MSDAPKLGIIAGGGQAPRQVIGACQAKARPFFVFCLEGFAATDLAQDLPHAVVALGSLQKLKDICAREAISEIVMIGHVRRPSIMELKPDWLALKVLTKIGLTSLGDDGLLRNVGKVLEEECGVRMIGVADVMADLLAPEGVLTKQVPSEQDQADIARGIEVAGNLGLLDVGQAAVIQQGIVLGVEAVEGTAELIVRAGLARREGGGGVLVKRAKPQQDRRYDLPTIGPDTVNQVHEAGLAGIAVEAGRSLIVEKDKAIARANELGLFIVGYPKVETP